MDEQRQEIEDCHTQIRNCVELLLPSEEQEEDEDKEGGGSMREHGIVSHGQGISIDLEAAKRSVLVEETPDNAAVFENLRGQSALLANRYLMRLRQFYIN